MATYASYSPYRSSYRSSVSRRGLHISFPKLSGLFRKRRSLSKGFVLRSTNLRQRRVESESALPVQNSSSLPSVSHFATNVRQGTLKFEFGPMSVMVTLFLIACLMGLLYLMHFNQVATKGYDLRRLEAARQQLTSQNDIKNMKLADAKSMARVISSDRVSVMKRPAELIYVRGNTALASR
jgi:hypothetical protein